MKFTKKNLETIEPSEARQTFFDELMPGLAVKVSPTGHKAFYYCFRAGKGRNAPKKQIQLGVFPGVTVEQARLKARQYQAQVIQGQDPAVELQEAKTAETVAQVLKIFLAQHLVKKKAHTRTQYEGLARLYIMPELGKLKVEAVAHRDIARLHHELRDRPSMANRLAAVLSVFFNWCEANGYRERGSNPVPGLKKFSEKKRTDFLTAEDLGTIGAALADLERSQKISPIMAAALRVLILTGARKTEILSLKWSYLDLESGLATLPDSKTGFKVIQLPDPAVEVLKSLPRLSDEYVFPSFKAGALTPHVSELRPTWVIVLARAGIGGRWRIHDLRHALASAMVKSGSSLPFVGKILGHTQAATTERYAHLEVNPARQALETAVAQITEGWDKPPREGKVIPFRPRKAAGK
jgi:integrase